jgi:hypothetical protein
MNFTSEGTKSLLPEWGMTVLEFTTRQLEEADCLLLYIKEETAMHCYILCTFRHSLIHSVCTENKATYVQYLTPGEPAATTITRV